MDRRLILELRNDPYALHDYYLDHGINIATYFNNQFYPVANTLDIYASEIKINNLNWFYEKLLYLCLLFPIKKLEFNEDHFYKSILSVYHVFKTDRYIDKGIPENLFNKLPGETCTKCSYLHKTYSSKLIAHENLEKTILNEISKCRQELG